jgi:hypothetical protein
LNCQAEQPKNGGVRFVRRYSKGELSPQSLQNALVCSAYGIFVSPVLQKEANRIQRSTFGEMKLSCVRESTESFEKRGMSNMEIAIFQVFKQLLMGGE